MYYDALLKLCGYEPDEIERERQRIESAIRILEFTSDDFDRGEKRVRHYFDIELQSIRKMLGLWLKSLVDLVLSKEEGKKLVYTSMPPIFHILNGLAIVSDDVYVTSPDITLSQCVGGIFGKITPLMEIAEGDLLPPGSGICSPIQVKLGAMNKGIIPKPDLFVSSGFVCDQTPKIDELLNIMYGIPVLYADGPHDEYEKIWPKVSDKRVDYIAQESKDILKELKMIIGHSVTEEAAQRADARAENIFMRCNRIFDLVKKADPAPTGFNNIGTLARLAKLGVNTTTISGDIEGILDLFYAELQERVTQGKGFQSKGAPRVGVVTLHSIPEPIKIIEDAGLAVIVDFTGLAIPKVDQVDSNSTDFWKHGAETLIHFMGIKFARRLVHVCREWDLDGAILNYQIGCRDSSVETLKARDLLRKELGMPSLVIESDLTDPRHLSVEAMRNRVEAFAEVLQSKRDGTTG